MKKRILSNIMSIILGVGIGVGGYALKDKITEPEQPGIEVSTPEEVVGGAILNKPENHGIEMVSAKIAREEYAEYGVSPMAENAYTLTATVTPASASNKAVDWSVEFVDASDEWATGKSVTDYVTVTPTTDGALTATVANLGEFGEQIKVTAAIRGKPEAYAECTVEYVQKVTDGMHLSIGGIPLELGGSTRIQFEPDSGSEGPGGMIEAGGELSEDYTIATENFDVGVELEYSFYYEPTGGMIDLYYYVATDMGNLEDFNFYFDKRMFICNYDNGLDVNIEGSELTEEEIESWEDVDIAGIIMDMTEPLVFKLHFITDYGRAEYEAEVNLWVDDYWYMIRG